MYIISPTETENKMTCQNFGCTINFSVWTVKRRKQAIVLPSMFVEFDFVDGELWKDITENISKSQQTTTKRTILFIELQTRRESCHLSKKKILGKVKKDCLYNDKRWCFFFLKNTH